MTPSSNWYLTLAGVSSFLLSLLHLACIAGGPAWYRAMGAGERMAQMAARGHWYPPVMTFGIAAVLAIWGLYGWSGAGLIAPLPFLKIALCGITLVFLSRGLGYALVRPMFPGNSAAFWYWSSAMSLCVGVLYGLGLRSAWKHL